MKDLFEKIMVFFLTGNVHYKGTLAYLLGRITLNVVSSDNRNEDGKFVISFIDSGVGVAIPTRIVLWKTFGLQVRVKEHRRGFFEGEMDIIYRGYEYLVDYDDWLGVLIETADEEAFTALKEATKKSNSTDY
ncbi:MAG: hypothetical protein COA60_004505 [Robiginitomaculum sp.]|nr:hypothetical protein [Robiginitomaculum sp.]